MKNPSQNIYNGFDYDDIAIGGTKEAKEEARKLKETVKGAHRILFYAKAVFPFDPFPDEIIIDENKVDIIHRPFFLSKEVLSLPYDDIVWATSFNGVLLGSIDIEVSAFRRGHEPVYKLWQHDANKARRMINGLVTAHKQNIDLSQLDLREAKRKVEEIGMAEESIKS